MKNGTEAPAGTSDQWELPAGKQSAEAIEKARARQERRAAVEQEIRNLWLPFAQDILNLFASGYNLVVLAAPGGSGKSYNLFPLVTAGLRSAGRNPCGFDAFSKRNRLSQIIDDPSSSYDSFLLDEADSVPEEEIVKLFESLESGGKNMQLLVVIRQPGSDNRTEAANIWVHEASAHGTSAVIYDKLRPIELSLDLARRFFQDYLSNKNKRYVDFLIRNFPRHLRLLKKLVFAGKKNFKATTVVTD